MRLHTKLLVSVLLIATSAQADSKNQIVLKGEREKLIKLHEEGGATPFKVRINIPLRGGGSLSGRFDSAEKKNWLAYVSQGEGQRLDPSTILLLQGGMTRRGRKGVAPLSGSIYSRNGVPTLHVLFTSGRPGGVGHRSYLLKTPLSGPNAFVVNVASVPSSALGVKTCGSDAMAQGFGLKHLAERLRTLSSDSVRVARVATDADHEYSAIYGADTNAHIATIINAVSGYFEADLGIRLTLTQQHNFSSAVGDPYIATDSGALLGQFRSYTLTNQHLGTADIYHLFSGKDFDGSIIGRAYLGVVCNLPTYSFGISQRFHDSVDASVVAHEIGHNFGGNHDDVTSPATIMASVASFPGQTRFSATTRSEVDASLLSAPQCLSTPTSGTPTATATPTVPSPTATPVPPTPTTVPTPIPPTVTPVPPTVAPLPPTITPESPTVTPTPIPSATPRATTTPTPLPPPSRRLRSGNATSPGGAALDATVTDGGRVTITVTTANPTEGCTVRLQASTSKRALLSNSATLRAFVPETQQSFLRTKLRKRTTAAIHLQLRVLCAGGTEDRTGVVSIQPAHVLGQLISGRSWLASLRAKLG